MSLNLQTEMNRASEKAKEIANLNRNASILILKEREKVKLFLQAVLVNLSVGSNPSEEIELFLKNWDESEVEIQTILHNEDKRVSELVKLIERFR